MSRSLKVVLIFLLTGSMLSCAAVNQLNLLSSEQEVEIGRQAAAEIDRQVPLYDDPVVAAYIDDLGQALVRHSRRPELDYTFQVTDQDEVNAFALPGGWLYVNRGLITTAANESELAGVIGHEIGHVVGRHGARQITKQYGLAMLIELAVGREEGRSMARDIAGQFVSLGAGLTLLKYSRDAEREADYFAVQETYAAGIDPEGTASFFEKLLALHESEPEGVAVWFTTHPPTQERIASVRADIRKLPARQGLRKDSERFRKIKARILRRQAGRERTKRRK